LDHATNGFEEFKMLHNVQLSWKDRWIKIGSAISVEKDTLDLKFDECWLDLHKERRHLNFCLVGFFCWSREYCRQLSDKVKKLFREIKVA
jgi:hypothetical protein